MQKSPKNKILPAFIIIIFSFLGINVVSAQVNAYSFSQSYAGYTALTGTPSVAYTSPWDDHTSGAAFQATIPFTFTFDNLPYTQCFISPNGYITFGTTQPVPTTYASIANNTNHNGVASAFNCNLVSNGSNIVYDVIGVAPNRTFVIQWTDANRKLGVTTYPGDLDFQIRLSETTNVITFFYGDCAIPVAATTPVPVQLGIRGLNNDFAQGNVNSRTQGSSQVWGNPGATGLGNATTNVISKNDSYPEFGLQFIYTPALACSTPTALPSSLIIGATSITNNSFVGNSFTAATPAPSKYLVLRSTINVAPTATNIVNRTYYANGATYGSYYVVGNNLGTTFTQTGLIFNTTYYYWIIPYNDLCTGAPFYNMTTVLSGSATTCFTPTVAVTPTLAINIGGNNFTANWSAVIGATDYRIDVSTNNTFTAILPAYSNLSVGLVTSFNVSGLLPTTLYFYRVRAIGPGCILNSNTSSATTTCGYYTIPYTQNFNTFPLNIIPTCYARTDSNLDGVQWETQSINAASAPVSLLIRKSASPTTAMNDWFFMPGLNLVAGTSYRLTFKYNTGTLTTTTENLRVRLGNAQSDIAMTETLLDLTNINNTVYQVATSDFIAVSSGVYYIGFHGDSDANQTHIAIDDISVIPSPNCFEPLDLTMSIIAATTATISWTAAAPEPSNGYEYFISTSSTPPNGATVPTGSVGFGINTVNLSSLVPSTFYYIWVRGNCGPTAKSIWSIEETFNTECSIPTITSTTPITRCGFGTATLSAVPSVGATIKWYNSISSTAILASGNSYTTPIIGATTTYYVEAKSFGSVAKVGPTSPVNQAGLLGVQNYQASINFTVTSDTSLLSLDIFPLVSGQTGQLVLRNSSNVTITTLNFTTTVSGGATPQVIPINTILVPGNYNIYFATLPAAGVRMNTTNAFYPYTSSVADITGNSIDNTYNIGMYNWKFTTECLSPRIPITATVTSPPSLTISSPSSIICDGNVTPTVFVVGYAAYNSLVWSPNTGISGSFATGFTFNPTTTTTYTLTANQTSGSFCGNIITHTVTVNAVPPAIMVVPSAATICQNSIQPLNGSSGSSTAVTIFSENFNAATNGWTVDNTSFGGDTNASQWTLRPSGYSYSSFTYVATFISNDSSQFYLSNSDAQSAVPGVLTRTTLTSPSFNLAGYTTANLNIWHFLRYVTNDVDLIEVSIDGGTTWITIKSYNTAQGNATNFVNENINLAPYLGNVNVKLRFNFKSEWGYTWGINNVSITGTLAAALTWTPITDLYTNPAATIPYTLNTPLSVVYAKPTSTITYTATLTGSNGCFTSNTTTLTIVPVSTAGLLSSSQTICSNSAPNSLLIAAGVGSIIRWEYADNAAFTTNLTSIANTTSTLTPAQMGVFPSIRYFRAIVKNGLCNEVASNGVFVSYISTTWAAGAWSNGLPDSSKRAIFNGTYNSNTDASLIGTTLNACSVFVQSGSVTFNIGYTLNVENTVDSSGGALIFENNASLVQDNDVTNAVGVYNGGNVGNITYKRNTTPMITYDYTYWSTPVYPQTLVALSPLTLYDKYFIFNPTISYWQAMPSNSLMSVGKGYIIRAPQSHPSGSIYNGTFFGTPNSGTITTPILVSLSDLNLIGNPYPSSLRALSFLSDPLNTNVVDGTMYFWTHNTPITSNVYTSNDYAIYNYTGSVSTAPALATGLNNATPNGFVTSGQSFFIRGLNSGGVATFKNTMRGATYSNAQFFKQSENATSIENAILDLERNRFWLNIINNQGAFKQTMVGYIESATNNVDRGFDGIIVNGGNSVNIYSLVETTILGIQGRSLPFDINDVVPIGYSSSINGTFEIQLSSFDGFFETQEIFLRDKYLNVVHNIKNGNYSFVTATGTFNDRFEIIYQNTALNTNDFNANAIILYNNNEKLFINSGNKIMKEVKIFDIRGRLLQTKKDIYATEAILDMGSINQVLLVQITTDDLITITKKYAN
ncbi:hypothetical protein [Flavobacterium sp.]|uniref:Ig-like domain-containing protein n=1 Tax=Flavobacterium sp. TaxID=239 RepID=UPI003750C90D